MITQQGRKFKEAEHFLLPAQTDLSSQQKLSVIHESDRTFSYNETIFLRETNRSLLVAASAGRLLNKRLREPLSSLKCNISNENGE